jgi:hypothetical protein
MCPVKVTVSHVYYSRLTLVPVPCGPIHFEVTKEKLFLEIAKTFSFMIFKKVMRILKLNFFLVRTWKSHLKKLTRGIGKDE